MKNTIHDIILRTYETRGIFLSNLINLEKMIDIKLCNYFFPKEGIKKKELFELVFAGDKIPFGQKVQLFKVLVEVHNPEFLNNNKGIITEIVKFSEERNIFAHYITNVGEEAVRIAHTHLIFEKFKNSYEPVMYTHQEIDEKITRLIQITSLIREMRVG